MVELVQEVKRQTILFHVPICRIFKKAILSWFCLDKTGLDIVYLINWAPEKDRATYRQEIARKMNKAREIFLAGDYEWFFNVEDDIVIPKSALQKLLAQKVPLTSGITNIRATTNPLKPWWPRVLDPEGPQDSDDRWIEEGKDFTFGDIIESTIMTFSCVLIKREIIEKIKFDDDIDVSFGKAAYNAGYKLLVNTGVKCSHLETTAQH